MVAILPFLKRFARNKMIWPFLNVEENGMFKSLFWRNLGKTCNI